MIRNNGMTGTNRMVGPVHHSQITQPLLIGDSLSAAAQQLRTRLAQSPVLCHWARQRVGQWRHWLTVEEKENQRLLAIVEARIKDLTEEAGWRFWLFGRNRSQALAQARFEKQVLKWVADTGRTHPLSSEKGETVSLSMLQKKWWQVLGSSQYSRTPIDVLFMGIEPGALPKTFSLQKVLTFGTTRGEDRLFNQPVADFRKSLAQWPWWRRLWRWAEYRKYQQYLRGYDAMCANRTLQEAAAATNAIERDLLEPRADLSPVLEAFSTSYEVLQHPATQRYQMALMNVLCQLSQGCCYDATHQEMLCSQLSLSSESKGDDSVKQAIGKLSELHKTWNCWLEKTFTASRLSVSQKHWQMYYQLTGQLKYRWNDEQYEDLQKLLGQLKKLTEQEVKDLRALIAEDTEVSEDEGQLVALWHQVRYKRLETLETQWQQVKAWHTDCMQTDKTFTEAYQRLRNYPGSSVATCYALYERARIACQTALKAWEASVPTDLDTRDGPGLTVERYRTFFKQQYDTIKSKVQQYYDQRVKKAYEKSQGIPALVQSLRYSLKEDGLALWQLWWQTYSTAAPSGSGKAGTKAKEPQAVVMDEFTKMRRQINASYREIGALYQYQLSRRDSSVLDLSESALALDFADVLGERYYAAEIAEAEKWYNVYQVLMSWVHENEEALGQFSQIAQDFSSRYPVGGDMSVYDPIAGCAMKFRYDRDRRKLDTIYKRLSKLAERPVDEVSQRYCTQWLQRCKDEAVKTLSAHYKRYEDSVKAMALRWDKSKRVCLEAFRWTPELEQAHKEIQVQKSDRDHDCKETYHRSAVPDTQEKSSLPAQIQLTPAHWTYHYHTILVDFFIRVEHWLSEHLQQGRKTTSADFEAFVDIQCRVYQTRGKKLAVHFHADKRGSRQAPHPAVDYGFFEESLSWELVDKKQNEWGQRFADTRAYLLTIFKQSEGHEKVLAWASATRYVHQCRQLLNLEFASHRYPVLDDEPAKENPLGYAWKHVVDLDVEARSDTEVANDSGVRAPRVRQEASSATDSLGQIARVEGRVFSESALAPLGEKVRPRASFKEWQREMDGICDKEYDDQLIIQDIRMGRYATYELRKARVAAEKAKEESERQLANLSAFLIAKGYDPAEIVASSIASANASLEDTAAAHVVPRAVGFFAATASSGVSDETGVAHEVLPKGSDTRGCQSPG
jgi:hypothetical protein